MLGEVDGKMVLSTWGNLIWNQCKGDLLSGDLMPFPRLEYQDTFRADYNKVKKKHKRVKLQETLATVSSLLNQSNGNTATLKEHKGIQYSKLTNKGDIDHFRVTQRVRVSCAFSQGKLNLYHYDEQHDYINNNPY